MIKNGLQSNKCENESITANSEGGHFNNNSGINLEEKGSSKHVSQKVGKRLRLKNIIQKAIEVTRQKQVNTISKISSESKGKQENKKGIKSDKFKDILTDTSVECEKIENTLDKKGVINTVKEKVTEHKNTTDTTGKINQKDREKNREKREMPKRTERLGTVSEPAKLKSILKNGIKKGATLTSVPKDELTASDSRSLAPEVKDEGKKFVMRDNLKPTTLPQDDKDSLQIKKDITRSIKNRPITDILFVCSKDSLPKGYVIAVSKKYFSTVHVFNIFNSGVTLLAYLGLS